MAITRRFINGNKVRFAGIAQVDELPEAVSVDVLDVVGSEVEIYAGPASALRAFLDETRTTVDSVVTLADGTEVSKGSFGESGATGYAFWFPVGNFRVYGTAAPGLSVETLVRSLRAATISSDADGVSIAATRSPNRRPSIMQMVPGDYLIDVKQARTRGRTSEGRAVAGGLLSRSDPSYPHPYLVLDADQLLAYFLPVPGRDISVAVEGASRLVLEAIADTQSPSHTHGDHAPHSGTNPTPGG